MPNLPPRICDAHAHAFPDRIAAAAMQTLTAHTQWMPVRGHHDGTVAGLLESMDHAGIARAILCSIATKPAQVPKITEWSAAVASDRIVPFASIHPDYEEPEAECRRIADLGLKGLKFHPQYMNCALDDPRTLRIAKAAAADGLALCVHAGYDLSYARDELAGPRALRALHLAVPELRLLACHLGGWERWEEVLRLIVGLPIYLETSFCLGQCPPELLKQILARHSPDYLLFGTDSPWADQKAELDAFRALPLSDDLRQRALWDNAERFIG